MVVSLELFKKSIAAIEAQMERDDILTDLLIGDECSGWISTAPLVVDCLVKLLEESMSDADSDWISWWLWEREEGKTDKIWTEYNGEKYRFDIKDTEDLYYLILDDLDKIKEKCPEEPPEYNDAFNEDFGRLDKDSYKIFMDTIFGNGYTESEN